MMCFNFADNPRVSPIHDEDPFESGDSKTNQTETSKKAAHIPTGKSSQPFAKRRAKTTSIASIALKPTSPPVDAGNSYKKFRPFNILTKKSSPRLLEKSPSSPKSTRFLHANILYKKAHSFEDVSDPKTREKLKKELQKRVTKRKKSESSKLDANYSSENGQIVPELHSFSNKTKLETMGRQDSGVGSSCSFLPTPTPSTPNTPLCKDPVTRELKFQYPPSPELPTILTPPHSDAEISETSSNDKVSEFTAFRTAVGFSRFVPVL